MSALGILGGTFDPVHRGHVILASGVREALGFDRVLLVPCSVPPHKPAGRVSAAYHRLEMLYLAVEGWPGLAVAADELSRGGVSYAIDTLRALRAAGARPVFVAGSDAIADLSTWREPDALVREFDFASVGRPRGSGPAPAAPPPGHAGGATLTPAELPADRPIGSGGRIVRVDLDVPPVSSSLVRARAREGGPLSDLVPPRVARYIQRHRLYR